MPDLTIAFADLTGSVSVFEALGNDRATKAITRITQWIGVKGQEHGGKVVKMLGDGVLMSFPDPRRAVEACTQIQTEHTQRVQQWPAPLKLQLQIGLARGPVVLVDGDCFGDAVNMASRLSDLAGPEQILASASVIAQLGAGSGVRFRNLGAMQIRGKTDPSDVFRIEWQTEVHSEFLTVPAALHMLPPRTGKGGGIELIWLDTSQRFAMADLPVHIGRVAEAQFVVSDPRVSRLHARIDHRSGNFVLEDTSSYGTWVRFEGSDQALALRRQECVPHAGGAIVMGAPFTDFTAPTIRFRLARDAMELMRPPRGVG